MASFHSRLKSISLRWFFDLQIFLIQQMFQFKKFCFHSALFSGLLWLYLAWKVKEALGGCWFCWFSLCMAHLTYYFSDASWFVQSSNSPKKFARIFPTERLHPTDKIWLVFIICLAIIIGYYHLVSLHEKNQDHYILAASYSDYVSTSLSHPYTVLDLCQYSK